MQALEPGDPRFVGRYRILARIGAGGMAVSYFGRSPGTRAAAVKVMHAEFAADPLYRARFRTEIAAARKAGGAYSPSVLDADLDTDRPWLATEFLPSVSLRDALHLAGPLPAEAVWPLAMGLVEALASIHRAGIVHLDVKPANVLLTVDGPRLIDFGVAVDLSDGTGFAGPFRAAAGTRGFMPPEQVAGIGVGPSVDVFALGATLATALSGVTSAEPRPATEDDRLNLLIMRCRHPDPADRPTLSELATECASRMPVMPPASVWLPTSVAAQIDRQTVEADSPPSAGPAQVGRAAPATRTVLSRRTLLLGAGGFALAAGGLGAGAFALLRDGNTGQPVAEPTRTAGGPEPRAAPSTTAAPTTPVPIDSAGPIEGVEQANAPEKAVSADGGQVAVSVPEAPRVPASSPTAAFRRLELYLTGTATVISLTTTVAGRSVTAQDVPLPYRRIVDIQQPPVEVDWQVDFRIMKGDFYCSVSVDGVLRVKSASGINGQTDLQDSFDGTV